MQKKQSATTLTPYLSELSVWALGLGTALGWGSLVVTSNTYLLESGPVGSIIGVVLGAIVMLVIANNYKFFMERNSDCGGAYSFVKEAFGWDHAFICGWFLALVYFAILWANATSIPLFVSHFLGDILQFGFSYTIFGYKVFFGEALVCSLFLAIFCYLLIKFKNITSYFMIAMVMFFFFAICLCFSLVMSKQGGIHPFNPSFIPNHNRLWQILNITCISPWAFIGFENISNATEEFKFNKDKSHKILNYTILTSTILYLMFIVLSVSVFPSRYSNWLEYIRDLKNLTGIEALPAFYAVNHYLGIYGHYLLMLALIALVLTSLIGNTFALSRLLYKLAQDEIIPKKYAELDRNNVPLKTVWLIIWISVFIPFLGRTAISWIVDVTTICATLIYGFVSASAWTISNKLGFKKEKISGIAGVISMIIFGFYLLFPSLITKSQLETESYFLFTAWATVGLVYFRQLLKKDNNNDSNDTKFGKSTIVWGILLSLIIITLLTWMLNTIENLTKKIIFALESTSGIPQESYLFLEKSIITLQNQDLISVLIFVIMIMTALILLISNYSFIVSRTHKLEIETKAFEIEHKRLDEELEISHSIQSSVLPHDFPERDRFDIYASMDPCQNVGGDYYDFFRVDADHEAIIIGDVSGKGITAALFMMNARATIKEALLSGKPLPEALNNANIILCKDNKARMFITVFIAVLDLKTGELSCVNAGHNPPLINRNGIWEYYKITHSPVIGASKKIKFTEVKIKLNHKDSLFMYTDGVTEAKNIENELYGEKRLIEFVSKQVYKPRIILPNVLDELKAYAGKAPQSDDITMVMFKYL